MEVCKTQKSYEMRYQGQISVSNLILHLSGITRLQKISFKIEIRIKTKDIIISLILKRVIEYYPENLILLDMKCITEFH